jgi:hypothetical protein
MRFWLLWEPRELRKRIDTSHLTQKESSQQRTIFGELMPFVAFLVSITSWD